MESPFARPPEAPKTSEMRLREEVIVHLEEFPLESRKRVRLWAKYQTVTFAEEKVVLHAVEEWWQERYGFPYADEAKRRAILAEKPRRPETGSMKMMRSLLLEIGRGDAAAIAKLKQKYLKTFPDELESVEVLFGIRDFLLQQKRVAAFQGLSIDERDKLPREERMKMFQDLTEYQFLFTHYILANSKDAEFMRVFWRAGEAVAARAGMTREFGLLRRGQISQVAVYKILEKLGKKPGLSHPRDDAFQAIDVWAGDDSAIQIKGWNEDEPAVVEAGEMVFPAASVERAGRKTYFQSAEMFKKDDLFRAKVDRYARMTGKEIKSYFFVVPYSKIDFVTGEPKAELVAFFKGEMERKDGPPSSRGPVSRGPRSQRASL